MIWLGFILCTAAIVYSGSKLSKYGDVIAEKSGLGRTWIGLVLMASVTSLPELVTGISAVTFADVPEIAVGDVLGSCVFNMLILAILDSMQQPLPLSARAHQGNILSGSLGILLLSIVTASLFMGNRIPPLGWIGAYSLFFVVIYFVAIRLVYFYEKRHIAAFVKEVGAELRYKEMKTKDVVFSYAANAVIVIVAAVFLPHIGERLAVSTGLGQTFVGNVFIALSTSLPEVVVSIAAVRMNAVDLAMGNLFGSNIFNILILAIDDLFFTGGHILGAVSPNHIVSASSAMAMTAIAIAGLMYRAEKKRLFFAWDSIGIMLFYLINLMMLYMLR